MSDINDPAPAPEAAPTAPFPAMPDRLSLDPRSPHFDSDMLQKGVRINFNGVEKTNVEEYCVSENWIKVAAGRSRDRHGNPMTLKLKGVVEPFLGYSGDPIPGPAPDEAAGIE